MMMMMTKKNDDDSVRPTRTAPYLNPTKSPHYFCQQLFPQSFLKLKVLKSFREILECFWWLLPPKLRPSPSSKIFPPTRPAIVMAALNQKVRDVTIMLCYVMLCYVMIIIILMPLSLFPPSSVKSRSPTSRGLTQPGYHLGHLSLGYWSFASVNTFQTACKYSSKQHVAPSASLYYTVVWWPITWRDHSEPANDWFGQLSLEIYRGETRWNQI